MFRQYVKDCIYPPPIICNIHWANDVCQKRKFSDMASKWNNLSRIKWKEEEEKRCVTFSFLMNLKLSLFFKSLAFYLFFFCWFSFCRPVKVKWCHLNQSIPMAWHVYEKWMFVFYFDMFAFIHRSRSGGGGRLFVIKNVFSNKLLWTMLRVCRRLCERLGKNYFEWFVTQTIIITNFSALVCN